MRRFLTVIFIFLMPLAAANGSRGAGLNSPFSLGTGARDLALAGSNLATVDPCAAPYWNPSRLAQVERLSLTGLYSRLYDADIPYQYFGLVAPTVDFGVFGLGVFRLGVDDIEVRDSSNFLLGTTSENRLGFYFAYARIVSGNNIGISVSFERHSLADYSATSSPGLNLSLSRGLNHPSSWLRTASIALVGRNLIKPKIKLAEEEVNSPTSLSAGLSSVVALKASWQYLISISASLTKGDNSSEEWAVGLEHSLKNLLHIRSGFRGKHLNLGAGIGNDYLRFDYAWIDRDLDPLNLFSISAAFGKSTIEKRKIRADRREAEFNRLMSESLARKNREMVDQLWKKGEEYLDQGLLPEANEYLEKSLFVARSIGEDTMRIAHTLGEARKRLEESTRVHQYAQFLDSAKIMLTGKDYLMARYYSERALEKEPKSAEANDALQTAVVAIQQDTNKGRTVINQISSIDSLINSGRLSKALEIALSLEEFASDYPEVKSVVLRVRVEYWKNLISTKYLNADLASCRILVDSAASLFPGNEWFSDFGKRLAQGKMKETSDGSAPAYKRELSPEMQERVADIYRQAQEEFKNGDLNSAISKWEDIERLSPGYSSVRAYLVNAYKFMGVELYGQNQMDDAIAIWSKAIALDPNNSEIDSYMKRTQGEIQKLKEMQYGR